LLLVTDLWFDLSLTDSTPTWHKGPAHHESSNTNLFTSVYSLTALLQSLYNYRGPSSLQFLFDTTNQPTRCLSSIEKKKEHERNNTVKLALWKDSSLQRCHAFAACKWISMWCKNVMFHLQGRGVQEQCFGLLSNYLTLNMSAVTSFETSNMYYSLSKGSNLPEHLNSETALWHTQISNRITCWYITD
jgi:hypothetical protein